MKNEKSLFSKDIYNFISIGNNKEMYVLEASFRKRHPEVSKRPMAKPYYALHLFLKGSGCLITDKGKFELKKGSIFVRFPSEEITYYDYPDAPWTYIFITFQGTKVPEYLERLGLSQDDRIFESNKKITSIFCDMITLCKEHPVSSDIIANALLQEIFAQIAITRCASNYQKYDIRQSYIMNALEFIDSNYQNSDLSADKIAKYLNLNIDYFLRIFKMKTGTPFSSFLISKRMSYAISMIDKGETSISKLAYAVGYLSPAYFTYSFKKTFNILPSEYIKNQHMKN